MIRKLFFLLFFLTVTYSFSQEELMGEWFLHDYNIDGTQYNNTFNSNFNLVFWEPYQPELSDFDLIGNAVCNGYGAYADYIDNSTLTIFGFGVTLVGCDSPGADTYEYNYFNVFDFYITDSVQMNFQITGTDNDAILILTNSTSNNYAVYGRQILSLDENLSKHQLKLVKNPVGQTLEIASERTIVDALFKIYNVEGKVLVTGSFKSKITINDLPKGLYLIEVTTSKGEKEILRFVKQ